MVTELGITAWRMPAEFEPQSRLWMLWPERADNWREGARPAQAAFALLASQISAFTPVTIGVNPSSLTAARAALPAQVRVVAISNNDAWMRDLGPSFVVDRAGQGRAVVWGFNAWGGDQGGLYAHWEKDVTVGARVAGLAGWPVFSSKLILEGGAIHVDGQGTLITTEQCLLNPNRNAGTSRAEIEAELRACLGVHTVIWLPLGLAGDETDGHVDNLACFLRPGLVALAYTNDPGHPSYPACQAAHAVLSAAQDARGERLELLLLPLPEGVAPMSAWESAGVIPELGSQARLAGMPLTASYVNSVFVNGGLILPAFGVATDAEALALFAAALPERQMVQVPAREILLGGGGLHCVTLAEPAVASAFKPTASATT